MGTLTMQFAGATVRREMALADAQVIRKMLDDERASDRIAWHHLRWVQFASEQVLFSDFASDEDLGCRLTPEDRATLMKHGHPRGTLATLVDHWRDRGREPAYSITALATLHDLALEGVSREEFGRWADQLEGEVGSALIQAALADADLSSSIEPAAKIRPEDQDIQSRETNSPSDSELPPSDDDATGTSSGTKE